jgi:hypothetical protein
MRNLRQLYRARPLPELLAYMRRQSDQLWTSEVRNAQDQFGWEWHVPFDKATAGRQSSALDAFIAAVGSSNLNLALGASASGSAACVSQESAERAIDGGSSTKWCSGGIGGQTLTIDLGEEQEMVGFRLRHAGAGGEDPDWNTRDFTIEVRTDAGSWIEVVNVEGNAEDVTTHPIPAVLARYARFNVLTSQATSTLLAARIYEFEVFGTGLE